MQLRSIFIINIIQTSSENMNRATTLATLIVAAISLAITSPVPAAHAAEPASAKPSDDFDFLFRLGMLEGHLLVGHELVQAKQVALALPHYGHPVKELYDDISSYLTAKKFPAFDKNLIALEAAVTAAPTAPDTEAQYRAVIATVHKARALAPADIRASLPTMIKVCADTIDAASGEYGEAIEQDRIAQLVEYHDSRGYLEYVAQQVRELKSAHPDAPSQALLDRFSAVLAKAQAIVGNLLPAPTPKATLAEYRGIAAEATAIAKP
jgi:hypothetical protein